jgi:hypothetical protein
MRAPTSSKTIADHRHLYQIVCLTGQKPSSQSFHKKAKMKLERPDVLGAIFLLVALVLAITAVFCGPILP